MRDKITPNKFKEELLLNLEPFIKNMNTLAKNGNDKFRQKDFIEWFNYFGRWMEIGTAMENEHWGEK